MAGFITLEDGRAYAASNWGYDAVVERIADALPETDDGHALKDWLMEQRVAVKGIGRVDLRELTLENRQLFQAAAREAFNLAEQQGPEGWHDPEFYVPVGSSGSTTWIMMMDSIRAGQPPSFFYPEMIVVIPPTGEQLGPGWAFPSSPQGRSVPRNEESSWC